MDERALGALAGLELDFRATIASGDLRAALEAVRDQLAAKLDSGMCSTCGGPRGEAAGIASLSARLVEVLKAINDLPDPQAEESTYDAVRKRYGSRVSGAEQAGTSRKSQARKQGGRRPGAGRRPGPGPVAGDAS